MEDIKRNTKDLNDKIVDTPNNKYEKFMWDMMNEKGVTINNLNLAIGNDLAAKNELNMLITFAVWAGVEITKSETQVALMAMAEKFEQEDKINEAIKEVEFNQPKVQ